MKLFSEAVEYGLRAVIWLTEHPGQFWTVREIAEGTQAKAGYLIRVVQILARAEIVRAQRGVGGGVSLKADPAHLSVLDVINAVDPLARIKFCPLGLKSHGTRLCSMHRCVDKAMATIESEFSKVTIQDLLSDGNPTRPLQETVGKLVGVGVSREKRETRHANHERKGKGRDVVL